MLSVDHVGAFCTYIGQPLYTQPAYVFLQPLYICIVDLMSVASLYCIIGSNEG